MEKEEFIEILGEAFHTSFRKATQHKIAREIWVLICKLPNEEWESILEFVYDSLPKKYYKLEF